MPASARLSHLLELADKGPALRAALAEEVAELLTAWPSGYPENMRLVCENLLATAARDIDADTQARLRVQLCSNPELSARVLPPRESALRGMVEAARDGQAAAALARALSVSPSAARTILDDDSGELLAIACKGAGIDRAAFSALALITGARREKLAAYALLDMFDFVPQAEAARRLAEWRQPETAHAA